MSTYHAATRTNAPNERTLHSVYVVFQKVGVPSDASDALLMGLGFNNAQLWFLPTHMTYILCRSRGARGRLIGNGDRKRWPAAETLPEACSI